MTRKRGFALAGLATALAAVAAVALFTRLTAPTARTTRIYGAFDTVITLTAYTRSQRDFDAFAAKAEARFRELHALFDIYHDYDGLTNLKTVNDHAGQGDVRISKEMFGLLAIAQEAYRDSGGAVDITLGEALALWRDYRERGGSAPPMDELSAAAQSRGMESLLLSPSVAALAKPGVKLDVGAIAKGYAAQIVADELVADIKDFIIDAGGNVAARGKPYGKAKWAVGVLNPLQGGEPLLDIVYVTNQAVVTSGNYERFYEVSGKRYGHIIDPDTLYPPERYLSVTVVAGDSARADVLSTALFILPYDEGAALAERLGADVLWLFPDGRVAATDGAKAMLKSFGGKR